MKTHNYIVIFLLISVFLYGNNLFAQAKKINETLIPVTTTDYSHPFVKMLEDVEMKSYENKKHWRKGNYDPYEFIRCDVDTERARLSYKKEKEENRIEFYLVYFVTFDGNWHLDFNDIAFQPKKQNNGTVTTLEHALKTKNKMYWFPSDIKK